MLESSSIWTNDEPRLHMACWDGEGPPLMLLHGLAGNAHWWDTTAPLLAQACRPVALDLRGHGDSGWRPYGDYAGPNWIADIEEARHALGWESMALCGHSLGARLAIDYALAHPHRLTRLVAIDFSPHAYQQKRTLPQPFYDDEAGALTRFRLRPPGTALLPEQLLELGRQSIRKQGSRHTWKFDWRGFNYRYEELWTSLPKLRTPALFVRGSLSAVVDSEDFSRLTAATPGAKAVTIAAHHHVPLDAPQPLAEAIISFLR